MADSLEWFRNKIGKELRNGIYSILILHTIGSSKEPTYGYKIIKIIEEITDGEIILNDASVYPLLKTLQAKGLVDSFWGKPESGAVRKFYTLTKNGKEALKIAIAEWESLSHSVRKVVKGEVTK